MLTHTLHLPPALSEIYGGPRPGWLKDLLDSLPCLQSLIVSKLPFFDHRAMVALTSDDRRNGAVHPYRLRLLLAESEPNTTSIGLAQALSQFPTLIYLDLSYTTSARDRMVLSVISELYELQVLKVRGIGLKDDGAEFLANAIGRRVRFLDLRNNMLTDMAVRSLMQASCFRAPEIVTGGTNGERAAAVQSRAASRSMSSDANLFVQHPDIDDKFVELLTRPLTGRFLLENLPHIGITHLLIAENQLTVEGVAGLLFSRLYMLDAGTVTAKYLIKGCPGSSSTFPGVEKLIPIIGSAATDALTYLRIHHAVVTKEPPIKDIASRAGRLTELPGQRQILQLDAAEHRVELDANKQICELPPETSRVELADTSIPYSSNFSYSNTFGVHHLSPVCEGEPSTWQRGPGLAPEAVGTRQAVDDEHAASCGEENELPEKGQPSASLPRSDDDSTLPETVLERYLPYLDTDPRSLRIKELLGKRPRNITYPLRSSEIAAIPYLHPCHIPHIETLILTDVPSHVPVDSPITSSLIRFIVACSDESLLASLQARADYSLPPGRARIVAEQQQARALFGLRRLVLEISPTAKGSEPRKLGPWRQHNAVSKSATGDIDSERLWSAASADFSFFGEDECGVPENDTSKYTSIEILNEKITLMPEDDESGPSGPSELDSQMPSNSLQPNPLMGPHRHRSQSTSLHLPRTPHSGSHRARLPGDNVDQQPLIEPDIDLVVELAKFRRSKKKEYEEHVKNIREQVFAYPNSVSSMVPLHIEGHWKGEVKIVRNASPKGKSGVVDIYGNYFEKGYLYP